MNNKTIRKQSLAIFKRNLKNNLIILGIILLVTVLPILLLNFNSSIISPTTLAIINILGFIEILVQVLITSFYLNQVRGNNTLNSLNVPLKVLWKYILLTIMTFILVFVVLFIYMSSFIAIGISLIILFVLFLVSGILTIRFSYIVPILLDNPKLGIFQGLLQSWKLTKGNFAKVLFVAFPYALPMIIVTSILGTILGGDPRVEPIIVGICCIFTPFIAMSQLGLYNELIKENKSKELISNEVKVTNVSEVNKETKSNEEEDSKIEE